MSLKEISLDDVERIVLKSREHESSGRTFGSKDIIIVHSGGQEFEISCLIPEENLNTCKIEVE